MTPSSTVVQTYTMDEFMDVTPTPDTDPRPVWRVALAEAVRLARQSLPDSHSRIDLAQKIVLAGDIRLGSDGTATVGSLSDAGTDYHVVNHACTCRDYERAPKNYCKHRLAHALLKRANQLLEDKAARDATLKEAAPEETPPVDDQTLPLPLPPATVDERLAQEPLLHRPATPGERSAHVLCDYAATEEPPMTEDETPYTPEPHDAPVATLEAPRAMTQPRSLAGQLMQWRADRQTMTRFLREELRAGVDYYELQIRGQKTRPTLSKAGSEKCLQLLQLTVTFRRDLETWEMLGKPAGLVCVICTLHTRSGEFVGEGRGIRDIKKDGGDANKTIKMAQKSGQIDAILRTGALSEVFSQDLEPGEESW